MKFSYLFAAVLAAAAVAQAEMKSHFDGGRVTPVHKLSLNDEGGELIVPSAENPMPVSIRKTCGNCHNYAKITSGFHFNASGTNCTGRMAEPWFWTDAKTGSQIPMSKRSFAGLWKPETIGLSNWEYTQLFARNMPGGDVSDPEDLFEPDGHSRWLVTGGLEANCFACHSTANYDHSEYVRQVMRQNWRWAGAAAFGLGDVIGMGERAKDVWVPLDGPNKDDKLYAVPPQMQYNQSRFDNKQRTVLEVGRPKDSNCLNCHGASAVGVHKECRDGDVHTRAGMACVDCHRNGENHDIARGTPAGCAGKTDSVKMTATCAGCHVGDGKNGAGRFGAPRPKHIGIPLVHFEKLSCTTCHSGVTPNGETAEVRTSRANRMGIYGRARWATAAPYIVEPVFVRNAEGKVEPRRMMWPSFWGQKNEKGEITPVRPDEAAKVLGDSLGIRKLVGDMLTAIAGNPNIKGEPVYIADGVWFSRNGDNVAAEGGKVDKLAVFTYADDSFQIVSNKMVEAKGEFWGRLVDGQVYVAVPEFDVNADLSANITSVMTDQLTALDASPIARGQAAIIVKGKMYVREQVEDKDQDGNKTYPIRFAAKEAPVKSDSPLIGWLVDGKFEPAVPAYVKDELLAVNGTDATLTEKLVSIGLAKFAAAGFKAVYVGRGLVFEAEGDKLVSKEDPVAKPVSWAVGHDVRPARMARGAAPSKCADCHSVDSKFFFGKVASTGPLVTSRAAVKTQLDYMGGADAEFYHRVFGVTFLMRPFFKAFLWVAAVVGTLVLLAFALLCIPALLSKTEVNEKSASLMKTANLLTGVLFVAAAVYLAFSGFFGWYAHGMTKWVIIGHMMAGGAFALATLLLIAFRAVRQECCSCVKHLFWALIAAAVGLFLTAVVPMMTWLGSAGQQSMLQAHRCLAGVCVILVVMLAKRLLGR